MIYPCGTVVSESDLQVFKMLLLFACPEFPAGCDSYHGPHSLTCKLIIWERFDCDSKGFEEHSSYAHLDEALDNYTLP